MQYMGGKDRISKDISTIIINAATDMAKASGGGITPTVVSLFCGACSMEYKLSASGVFQEIICNDKNEYLIALLDGVKNGYEVPEHMSLEEYQYIRDHKDEDKALTGFAGFACSFGGKWFGGYAKGSREDYCRAGRRSFIRDKQYMNRMRFISMDYREVNLSKDCIVYADPPYKNTTKYGYDKGFNTDEFWGYMREISKSHLVIISEQVAPNDFVCVWEKELRRDLPLNKEKCFMATEKLFAHECNKDIIQKMTR